MIVVRNVFRCKPGKAADLADRFRRATPLMQEHGMGSAKVMVDAVSTFWTVVLELEMEDLAAYQRTLDQRADSPELRDAMGNYMELVESGHREVFRVLP